MDYRDNPTVPPNENANPEVVHSEDTAPKAPAGTKWRWAILAIVILALAYPIASHLLADRSENSGNLLQVSAVRYQNHQYRESIEAALGYLKSNPGSADAYNNISVAYLQLGEYDQATRNATEALRLNPNYDLAKRNLAWIAEVRAKSPAPFRATAPTATAPPQQASALLNLSMQHYGAGRFAECVSTAKAAVKIAPAYAEAYNNLAACESSLKHYDAAISAAQEAIRLKPDFQLARNNLAWAIKVRAQN